MFLTHCAWMGLNRWCTCIRGRFHIQVKPNHIYKVGNDFKKYFDEHFSSCQLTQASRTAQFCSILALWPACVSWQLEKCSSKYFLKSFPALYIYGLAWLGCKTNPEYRYTICRGPFKRSGNGRKKNTASHRISIILLPLTW